MRTTMTKNLFRTCLLTMLMLLPISAFAQDFGLDIAAGVKKKIIKGMNIAAEFSLRTQDLSSEMERIDIGLDYSYKPIDYFKFGVGYDFIYKYVLKHETDDLEIVDSYWSPRNRVNVYVTGILPIGDFELSLRERYQFTHRSQSTAKRWNELGVALDNKTIKPKNSHELRSRLQGEYKIKPIHLTPYLSLELYNDLTDSFAVDKLRVIVGASYALHKKHNFDLFYRYTAGIADAADECHHLGIGYEFKF